MLTVCSNGDWEFDYIWNFDGRDRFFKFKCIIRTMTGIDQFGRRLFSFSMEYGNTYLEGESPSTNSGNSSGMRRDWANLYRIVTELIECQLIEG